MRINEEYYVISVSELNGLHSSLKAEVSLLHILNPCLHSYVTLEFCSNKLECS